MNAFFLVWSSVCRIWGATVFSGVEVCVLAAAVGSSTNQPYCDVFTFPTWFVFKEKRSLSNAGTVWPFVKLALPHFVLDVVSSEYLGDPEAAKAASEAVARQAG